MSTTDLKTACRQSIYEVTTEALPLSCPMPGMRLWDAHPRVYLPIDTGTARCPYCSAEYRLVNKADVEYANAGS
jgi:uncharacterized Zn-finger protein